MTEDNLILERRRVRAGLASPWATIAAVMGRDVSRVCVRSGVVGVERSPARGADKEARKVAIGPFVAGEKLTDTHMCIKMGGKRRARRSRRERRLADDEPRGGDIAAALAAIALVGFGPRVRQGSVDRESGGAKIRQRGDIETATLGTLIGRGIIDPDKRR